MTAAWGAVSEDEVRADEGLLRLALSGAAMVTSVFQGCPASVLRLTRLP